MEVDHQKRMKNTSKRNGEIILFGWWDWDLTIESKAFIHIKIKIQRFYFSILFILAYFWYLHHWKPQLIKCYSIANKWTRRGGKKSVCHFSLSSIYDISGKWTSLCVPLSVTNSCMRRRTGAFINIRGWQWILTGQNYHFGWHCVTTWCGSIERDYSNKVSMRCIFISLTFNIDGVLFGKYELTFSSLR